MRSQSVAERSAVYFTNITPPLTNSALHCFTSQREGVTRRARLLRVRYFTRKVPTPPQRAVGCCADSPRQLSDGGRVCARVQRVKRLGAVSEGQPALHYAA